MMYPLSDCFSVNLFFSLLVHGDTYKAAIESASRAMAVYASSTQKLGLSFILSFEFEFCFVSIDHGFQHDDVPAVASLFETIRQVFNHGEHVVHVFIGYHVRLIVGVQVTRWLLLGCQFPS